MENVKRFSLNALICCLITLLFAACAGNSSTNKTASSDTTAKPKWLDPQRGKIWGKVNIVQIPLTAIEEHILGPVKSVKYKDYKIATADNSNALDDSGYNVYDKFGHLVDQNEYKADGTPKWNCIYQYDNQNRATLLDFKVYDNKYITKTTFKYDSKGNKIEEDEVDPNKKYSSRTVYKYDNKGNDTGETRYDADNKIISVMNYRYDSRGFQTEMTMSGKSGKLINKRTQEYDNNGNKISGADYSYNADTIVHSGKWTATLDNKGRTIATIGYNKDGTIHSTSKKKYDDWDNEIESITYKPDGSIDTTAWNTFTDFVYDDNGNAIKETRYKIKEGKKVPTDFRETEYVYY